MSEYLSDEALYMMSENILGLNLAAVKLQVTKLPL
jgi:hypothetical protein